MPNSATSARHNRVTSEDSDAMGELPTFSPATLVWTSLDGVEHQCAANHVPPSAGSLTAAMCTAHSRMQHEV